MRSQDEIVNRYKTISPKDLFGFESDEYIPYLDYEHAKEYLKEGTTEEDWNASMETRDPHTVMKDYMGFAWEKANDCRGISASRSIQHYVAWLWLADDNDLWETITSNYEHYGKPQLIQICNYLNIDPSQYDDKIRTNYA